MRTRHLMKAFHGRRSPAADISLLLGRFCLATVFVASALDKFNPPAKELDQIKALDLPGDPKTLSTLAGSCEMIGAASLATGVFSRASAVLLAGFLGAVSFKELDFWSGKGTPEAIAGQRDAFFANVAIVGGLLYEAATGPGRLALRRSRWH